MFHYKQSFSQTTLLYSHDVNEKRFVLYAGRRKCGFCLCIRWHMVYQAPPDANSYLCDYDAFPTTWKIPHEESLPYKSYHVTFLWQIPQYQNDDQGNCFTKFGHYSFIMSYKPHTNTHPGIPSCISSVFRNFNLCHSTTFCAQLSSPKLS